MHPADPCFRDPLATEFSRPLRKSLIAPHLGDENICNAHFMDIIIKESFWRKL